MLSNRNNRPGRIVRIKRIYALGNKDISSMRTALNEEANEDELIPFLSSEPVDNVMNNVSKIQDICSLILLFFEWKNWDGVKLILSTGINHQMIVKALTDEFTKQICLMEKYVTTFCI